ncbi:M20/M25/M40 family metallo-hydrolase [Ferrimonas balearica]|uniref:M20/M25/M40 family metallo-hydrolase n=1 Tax=Ferrimonas balearica TaxID=44012 RepID=UPI001C98E78E|nr:M20/M25/M40 family metallo-hydrolase [Ferrimonas balearica]MBY5922817.1 M20/M25/M40 family metallo-hydrolase [Ferrimonas balearica]MBY5997806.1 M20/M25/M40 family metallo-hydrolase [Ferrimonas balearica]
MLRALSLLAATLMVGSPLAQPFSPETLQHSDALRQHAQQSDAAWQVLESLTTEVGPRLAGTEADARAVAWAKAHFEAMGFDEVRLEPVIVPHWERGFADAKVTLPFPQPLVITALGNSVATPEGGIEAAIVRFATLGDLQAADPAEVKGKLVFIDHKMERFKDGRGYGPVVKARGIGAVEAAKKGAVGLLLRSVSTSSHRFAHTGVMRYVDDVSRIPAVAISPPDADQLTRMLARQSDIRVKMELEAMDKGESTSYNVIGEIRGSSKPEEIVLIGAHLDSWDEGTGALDDGAGVAIVTAAAEHIMALKQRPKRTIRVVLYAAEEIGLIGAKAYRDQHKDNLDHHYIAAEADFGAGPIYRLDSRVNEAARPAIEAMVEQLAPLGVSLGHNESWGGPDVSVLPPLGVPVAGLNMDGSDYFDYHHTPDDTLDKVKPESLKQSTTVYTLFAWLMANASSELRPIPPTGE